MDKKIVNRLKELRFEIEKHNNLYYNEDKSIISDYEYDTLQKELESYEREYPSLVDEESPSQKVGAMVKSKFQKVNHRVAMLSLSNTYNSSDVTDFDNRVKKGLERDDYRYVIEFKYDGASISLHYENGVLMQAVTRGDGKVGEDVTDNILQIDSIPKKLNKPVSIEVRGEILFERSKFEDLNRKRAEKEEDLFANPRNAASGTLRQIDSSIVKERELDCFIYFMADADKLGFSKHSESLKYLEKLGFMVSRGFRVCENIDELIKAIEEMEKEKEKLSHDTDGLVMKIDEFTNQDILGVTSKSPKWAMAYKFPTQQATTKLLDITYQVGRTGAVTPVAELEAVQISGTTVRRASLHNFDEIRRKGIKIGDRVFVEKAAEIIPQVVKPILETRTGEEIDIIEPENCPVCKSKLYKDENEVALKCINSKCPEIVRRKIEYFVSRDAMNIDGLGPKQVEKFIELGKMSDITDIYKLQECKEELKEIDKMGEKSVENLIENIEKSKIRPYSKVIYSIGIPFVGKVMAGILAEESQNIEKLMLCSVEELVEIEGVGDKVAQSIVGFFQNENNRNIVEKLKEYGLIFQAEEKRLEANILEGKKFLVTGTLFKYKRDEIKDIIDKFGGKNMSSVSKNLDYLIAGEKAGSKLEKANKLGVTVISEDEFEVMIRE